MGLWETIAPFFMKVGTMNNGRLCLICERSLQGRKNSSAVICAGECEKEHKRRAMKELRVYGSRTSVKPPPEKSKGFIVRRSRLRCNGLDYDQADLLADDPTGYCNACGDYGPIKVDHDHNHCPYGSGCAECIRGFLCGSCNLALGHVRNDINRLRSLIIYLEETN
jgi:hypothetical protein